VCLAIPAEVLTVGTGDVATVDMSGVRREIDVGLLDGVLPGDWVLVHLGFALTKIDEDEARSTIQMLERIVAPPDPAPAQPFP
jgi:hydrogenase expression/formation protein HypC